MPALKGLLHHKCVVYRKDLGSGSDGSPVKLVPTMMYKGTRFPWNHF